MVAPFAPVLSAVSDTGSSSADNITNSTNPVFTGGGASAGALVRLYAGSTQVGQAIADTAGNWRATASNVTAGSGVDFTVDQVDAAGNISARSAALSVNVDRSAPAVPVALDLAAASDSGISNTDNYTNIVTPTITGTAEAGSQITLYGTGYNSFTGQIDPSTTAVIGTAVADNNGAWSIVTSKLSQSKVALTAKAVDAAGNVSAASGALDVTIRTFAGGLPAMLDLDNASDTGISAWDNITADNTPTFTGPGEYLVELFDGATPLASFNAPSGSWTYTAAALSNGEHELKGRVSDIAGNVSMLPTTVKFIVDTQAPTTFGDADAAANAVDLDTINGAKTGLTVLAADSTAVTYSLTNNAGGRFAIDSATGVVTVANSSILAEQAYTITARATDAAGNASSSNYQIQVTDINKAAGLSAPNLAAASDNGRAWNDNITNAANPVFNGAGANAGATVRLYAGDVQVGSAVADASGKWSITANGIAAGSNIAFTVDQVGADGSVSGRSASLAVTIDRISAAAPSIPDLAAVSDSGQSSTDNITNVVKPTLTGTAEAGATITLYSGTKVIGTTIADANGTWNVVTDTLGQATHSVTATATDVAGNVSAASGALSLSVITFAGGMPGLSAWGINGNASSSATNNTRPTFSGSGASGTMELFDGTTLVGKTAVAANGTWSITSSTLSVGEHHINIKMTDVAGNVLDSFTSGATLTPRDIVVDVTAPNAPGALHMAAVSDTGLSNTDNVTGNATPTITGTAEAGSTIKLYSGSSLVGTATTAANGNWSVTTSTLANGAQTLTAKAVDAASNGSAMSALSIVVDRTAPTALTDSDAAVNQITLDAANGTATGLTVKTTDISTLAYSLTNNANGLFSIDSATGVVSVSGAGSLLEQVYTITAVATDLVGNAVTANFQIDVQAPVQLVGQSSAEMLLA